MSEILKFRADSSIKRDLERIAAVKSKEQNRVVTVSEVLRDHVSIGLLFSDYEQYGPTKQNCDAILRHKISGMVATAALVHANTAA